MTVRIATRARSRPAEPGLFDRLLDPIDRLAATIFSVLVVLGFTLAYRVLRLDAGQTPDYASRLFFAALGAAFAGGVIDGIMFALLGLFARGEKHRLLNELKAAETPDEGVEIIADELDEILEPITREERREELYVDMLEHLVDSQPQPVRLEREDALGAVGCVVVAVLAVLPSLAPLLLFGYDPVLGIRVSNFVSFGVLFATGYHWGRYAGANPWKTGATVAAISAVMVVIAIPLGG